MSLSNLSVRQWVTVIGAVAVVLPSLGSAWLWHDSRYAHAEPVKKEIRRIEQQSYKTMDGLHRQMIINELNRLTAKEHETQLNQWEKVHKQELEKEWEMFHDSR